MTTPCWWVDYNDCWEISHFPTREEAEDAHTEYVRRDHGWPLSSAGCFAIDPAPVVQESERCLTAWCPDCKFRTHADQGAPDVACVLCGEPLPIEGKE